MPSNIYNKKKHVRDSRYWTEGFNFEWGHGFELREVPIAEIGDGMKGLTFSQCCKVLHWWSQGMAICVGVNNYIRGSTGGVLINPERKVRIGDCSSIFVICNDYELLLAMLNTEHLSGVLRKMVAERTMSRAGVPEGTETRGRLNSKCPAIELSGECYVPETPAPPVLLDSRSRVRTDSHWMTSWINNTGGAAGITGVGGVGTGGQGPAVKEEGAWVQPEAQEAVSPTREGPREGVQSLEFKRGPRCFRVEVEKNARTTSDSPANESSFSIGPGIDATPPPPPALPLIYDAPPPNVGGVGLSKRDSAESLGSSTSHPAFGPPTHKMGRFLTFLPESSVVYGDEDDEYSDTSRFLIPKHYSDHGKIYFYFCSIISQHYFNFFCLSFFVEIVVLVCAFQPTYSLVRIVAAVETFVSATRSRSDEIIVVLCNRAEQIEKRLAYRTRVHGEFFDNKLYFVQGIPNSVRHLRVG
jgi:hypothetical protein